LAAVRIPEKALAATKCLLFWWRGCASRGGQRGCFIARSFMPCPPHPQVATVPGDLGWQTRGACIWALANFYNLMDARPRYLSRAEADEMATALHEFVVLYLHLAKEAHTAGANRWHRVPKLHYQEHLVDDIRSSQTNPRFHHCYCDEDYVGRIGRGSRRCHRSTVVRGVTERYISMLYTKWSAAA
jgi:hypothetical protein